MKKGCIILIIIAVIIVIGAALLWINKDKIINFAMEKSFEAMEKAVVTNLPVSVSQDSARVLFDRTFEKIKSREIDSQGLRDLMLKFQSGMRDRKLDSLEVSDILQDLKKITK
jgi:hypothetical protein